MKKEAGVRWQTAGKDRSPVPSALHGLMGNANLRGQPSPVTLGKLANLPLMNSITWIAARVSIARHVCHAWPRTWQTGKLVNNNYGCFRLMRAAGLSPTIRQSTTDRALVVERQRLIL